MFVFYKKSHGNLLLWFISNLETYSVAVNENEYVVTSTDEEALELYRICKGVFNNEFYLIYNNTYCMGLNKDYWIMIHDTGINMYTHTFDQKDIQIISKEQFFKNINNYEIFKTISNLNNIISNFN